MKEKQLPCETNSEHACTVNKARTWDIVETVKTHSVMIVYWDHLENDNMWPWFRTDNILLDLDKDFNERIIAAKRESSWDKLFKFVSSKWKELRVRLKDILLEC